MRGIQLGNSVQNVRFPNLIPGHRPLLSFCGLELPANNIRALSTAHALQQVGVRKESVLPANCEVADVWHRFPQLVIPSFLRPPRPHTDTDRREQGGSLQYRLGVSPSGHCQHQCPAPRRVCCRLARRLPGARNPADGCRHAHAASRVRRPARPGAGRRPGAGEDGLTHHHDGVRCSSAAAAHLQPCVCASDLHVCTPLSSPLPPPCPNPRHSLPSTMTGTMM